MRLKSKLVCGVGVNDADYAVTQNEYQYLDGKKKCVQTWMCPFYSAWKGMLSRAYDAKRKEKFPSYSEVFVCKEWHLFSNFKNWMLTQKWEGNDLDKDILFKGNKEYNPEKSLFVPKHINYFVLECDKSRGVWPIGVYYHKAKGKFIASSSENKKKIHIGNFDNPEDAHNAWRAYKHSLATKYADQLEVEGYDTRLVEALRTRYM